MGVGMDVSCAKAWAFIEDVMERVIQPTTRTSEVIPREIQAEVVCVVGNECMAHCKAEGSGRGVV
jgi:hypothetical protein